MVTNHPKATRRKCSTDIEFGIYTYSLRQASEIWSPTFLRIITKKMVTHDLKHGYPPTKIKKLKKLQPNKEFDTSAAQLVTRIKIKAKIVKV